MRHANCYALSLLQAWKVDYLSASARRVVLWHVGPGCPLCELTTAGECKIRTNFLKLFYTPPPLVEAYDCFSGYLIERAQLLEKYY